MRNNVGYTENICPNCGNTVLIDNDRKIGVCMACAEIVGNEGYSGPRTESGCSVALAVILLIILSPFVLIGCLLSL